MSESLSFEDIEEKNHSRVLGGYSRPGLEIVLICCSLTNTGAHAFAEILVRSQGKTKLHSCRIDNFVIADGLRGNSRLKIFSPHFSNDLDVGVGNRQVLAITDAVRESKGLVMA